MDDLFKIYIDRLRKGEVEHIEETFPAKVLEIEERDFSFEGNVALKGDACITDGNLVFCFGLSTEVKMPCAICNEWVAVAMEVSGTVMEELTRLRGGVFHFKEAVRETLLLEVPMVTECAEGNCPERKNLVQYLGKKEESYGSSKK